MKVLYYKPLEYPKILDIDNNYETICKLIGCELIECVYPFDDDVVVICDDTGAINGKQFPNRLISKNIIFGPFIVCGIDDLDFISLSDELTKKYYDLLFDIEVFRLNESNKIEAFKLIGDKLYEA